MNQLCKVCGESAAGFHFGAFTCEGCKSFFGRTYNNMSSIAGCKNNSECVINKKNRTACKACRLRKCLLVGMSKSGSRYGRRSNWFKIHCLLQEQQSQPGQSGLQQMQMPPTNTEDPATSANREVEHLFHLHHMQQSHQSKQRTAKSAIPLAVQNDTTTSTPDTTDAASKSHSHASDSIAENYESGPPPQSIRYNETTSESSLEEPNNANGCSLNLSRLYRQPPRCGNRSENSDFQVDFENFYEEQHAIENKFAQLPEVLSNPIPAHVSSMRPSVDSFNSSTKVKLLALAAACASVITTLTDGNGDEPSVAKDEEPIDLSLKSHQNQYDGRDGLKSHPTYSGQQKQLSASSASTSTSRTSSVYASPDVHELDAELNVIQKRAPLDLTLLRS